MMYVKRMMKKNVQNARILIRTSIFQQVNYMNL